MTCGVKRNRNATSEAIINSSWPWLGFRAIVGLLVISNLLLAHHSPTLYDTEHIITLTGIVTQYEFVNPHARIHFNARISEVNADVKIEMWVAESASPLRLYRAGWRNDTLKSGDQITVTGSPMKNRAKFLAVRTLTGPDGKILTQGVE
jgi:hypothetical protein